jgi:hypothetical protein
MKYKNPCLPVKYNENVIEETASVTGTSDYKVHTVSLLILSLAFALVSHKKSMDGSATASL